MLAWFTVSGEVQTATHSLTHTHTHTNLDFTEARDSEWQWNPLGHMQVCTSLQTENHASTHRSVFLQAGCPSCRPTNSIKALKAISTEGSKIHIGFTSLEPAHPGSPGQRATKRVCVCSASYVSCKRGTACICCCGVVAAERRAAIDRYILPVGRSAANPQQRHVNDGIDEQTGGQTRQTDGRPTVTQTLPRVLRGQCQ